jgi:hypothetical protein
MIVGRCLLNCSRVFSTVVAAQIKVAVGVGWGGSMLEMRNGMLNEDFFPFATLIRVLTQVQNGTARILILDTCFITLKCNLIQRPRAIVPLLAIFSTNRGLIIAVSNDLN